MSAFSDASFFLKKKIKGEEGLQEDRLGNDRINNGFDPTPLRGGFLGDSSVAYIRIEEGRKELTILGMAVALNPGPMIYVHRVITSIATLHPGKIQPLV